MAKEQTEKKQKQKTKTIEMEVKQKSTVSEKIFKLSFFR